MTKFCVDCKHYAFGLYSRKYPADHTCTKRGPLDVDQITGEKYHWPCEQMRRIKYDDNDNAKQCIDGRFWEAK
jgi:hypothetical protein